MGWAILICLGFSVGAFNGGAWPIGLLFAVGAILCFLVWIDDSDTAAPEPEPVYIPSPAEQLEAARQSAAAQLEAARREAADRDAARRAELAAHAQRIAEAARARAATGGWE
jgi:hypothetical protein